MAVYEVAIASHDFGPGRAQEGDIIEARKPLGYVGQEEQSSLLWLILETDEEPEALKLKDRRSRGEEAENLPLEQLNSNGFSFSLDRVRDKTDKYQPGLGVHPVTGEFTLSRTPKPLADLKRYRAGRGV